MALHFADKWVWDFWFARDGADYHLFYLQANRSLKEERLRHWNVSIGHAVSQDLRNWKILPDALRPSPEAAEDEQEGFDSFTTWTGSVIQHNDLWYLFYTGSKLSEKGQIQRVGLATSPDLMTWTKHPNNPLITADPRWYEQLDLTAWHDQAWRDPFVFWDAETQHFHAFITGRAKDGAADGRGVVAHAQSTDLITWEMLPPVTEPGEFGQMEVPQVLHINGRYYLLFCTSNEHYSAVRRARVGDLHQTGTHYLVADHPFGPYRYLTDEFMAGDKVNSLYAGKLVQDPTGEWQFMAFRHFLPNGEFVGDIIDPIPLTIHEDGRLTVEYEWEN